MRNRLSELSVRSWLRNRIPDFTGLLRVKAGLPLLRPILQVGRVVAGTLNPSWVKVSFSFIKFLMNLWRAQGTPGVVKHLKVASVVLQQASAGYRVKDLTSLGPRLSRTGTGLPRIIPYQQRQRILAGDSKCIKFWLSLFSLYRVLEFEGAIKTETITKPGVDLGSFQKGWKTFLATGFAPLIKGRVRFVDPLIETFNLGSSPHPISRAAPTVETGMVSTSWSSIVESARRIAGDSVVWKAVRAYAYATNNSWVVDRITDLSKVTPLSSEHMFGSEVGALGKLGLKVEPAGKVRVFAMVDPWTQWLLAPLHQRIFSILRKIPEDGTFNQTRPVERLLARGLKRFWSYDLSAATDRLPVSLQAQILDQFFGLGFGEKWRSLLVERDYYCPDRLPGQGRAAYKPVRYAVGQPMGALSSWAMLAVTHHALIQYASFRVSRRDSVVPKGMAGLWRSTWFEDYAVLGDDVVIANGRVAREYLRVMSEIGVEVGLAKSLVSPRGATLEFAKRFWFRGQPASPVSFLELAVSTLTISGLAEFSRKWELSYASVLAILDYRHKVLGGIHKGYHHLTGRISAILWMVARKRHSLVEWLSLDSVEPRFDSRLSLPDGEEGATNWMWSRLEKVIVTWISDSLQRRLRSLDKSVGDMIKWANAADPNDALRQWITAQSVRGVSIMGEVDEKVSAIVDNSEGSYSPRFLLREWEVLWGQLAQVVTLDTITARPTLDEEAEDPMVTATLNELRLLRSFKNAAKSVREPFSLTVYIRDRLFWLRDLFLFQFLSFLASILRLREMQTSVVRRRELLLEILIQCVNAGLGSIIGVIWAMSVIKREVPEKEWIDFWPVSAPEHQDGVVPALDLSYWILGCITITLCMAIYLTYSVAGAESAVEEVVRPLTAVERFQSGVPGPYSVLEWQEVQDYLAIVAWEENLALSPIAGKTAIDWLQELPG